MRHRKSLGTLCIRVCGLRLGLRGGNFVWHHLLVLDFRYCIDPLESPSAGYVAEQGRTGMDGLGVAHCVIDLGIQFRLGGEWQ